MALRHQHGNVVKLGVDVKSLWCNQREVHPALALKGLWSGRGLGAMVLSRGDGNGYDCQTDIH